MNISEFVSKMKDFSHIYTYSSFIHTIKNFLETKSYSYSLYDYIFSGSTFILLGIFFTSCSCLLYNRSLYLQEKNKEKKIQDELKKYIDKMLQKNPDELKNKEIRGIVQDLYTVYIKEHLMLHALDLVHHVGVDQAENYIREKITNITEARKFVDDFRSILQTKDETHSKTIIDSHEDHDSMSDSHDYEDENGNSADYFSDDENETLVVGPKTIIQNQKYSFQKVRRSPRFR